MKIHISGPLSLLSSTKLYVSALCSLLPILAWHEKFVLDIFTERNGKILKFRYRPQSGMRFGKEPKLFDSKVESKFFKEFSKIEGSWNAIREPEPIATSTGLFFPDFGFIHKLSGQKCLLEIVGFWRPDYLEQKIAKINAFNQIYPHENIVVCVDSKIKNFKVENFPRCQVVFYDKSVAVQDFYLILKALENF